MPANQPSSLRPRTRSWWPTPAGQEALAEHRRLCLLRWRPTDQGRRALAERASAEPGGRS